MKLRNILFLLVAMLGIVPATAQKGKVLVVYFSHSGNTRQVAKQIQAQTGADIYEIVPAKPYTTDYKTLTEVAKQEKQNQTLPAIKGVPDVSKYQTIILGSPNWWATWASPIFTFLSKVDLSGKTVLPFITHEGSALGTSVNDLKRLEPKATVKPGLAIRGSKVRTAQNEVKAWLQKNL